MLGNYVGNEEQFFFAKRYKTKGAVLFDYFQFSRLTSPHKTFGTAVNNMIIRGGKESMTIKTNWALDWAVNQYVGVDGQGEQSSEFWIVKDIQKMDTDRNAAVNLTAINPETFWAILLVKINDTWGT